VERAAGGKQLGVPGMASSGDRASAFREEGRLIAKMLGNSGFCGCEDLGGEDSRVTVSTGAATRTEGSNFKSLRGLGGPEPEMCSPRNV
jgi:hypothetical protein